MNNPTTTRFCLRCGHMTPHVLRTRYEGRSHETPRRVDYVICQTCGRQVETLPDPAPGRVLPRQGRGE